MKKAIAIVLTLILALSVLAACGAGGSGSGGGVKSVPGETKSFGKLSVLVPNGFTFEGGSLINAEDENTVRLSNDEDYKFNFTFTVGEAGDGESHVADNRMFNSSYDATDITDYKTGDYTWTGVSFSSPDDDSWTSYALYTTLADGRDLKVAMSVTPGNDDVAKAVLASVQVAEAAEG